MMESDFAKYFEKLWKIEMNRYKNE